MSEPVITVTGPTATGKTRLAAALAKELNGEIISADSRQVYRRMDIGTGKDIEDYSVGGVAIPYHLIDIAEPGEEYNVAKWQQAAYEAMAGIKGRGRRVILCGGSGMYVEALLKGYRLSPVPLQPELRAELEKHSEDELVQMLASFRPLHNHTDTCEHHRLIHALELEIYYHNHPELQTKSVQSYIFGLKGDRDLIRSKITERLKTRLENGLIEEVENLISENVSQKQLLKYGLEYKFVTMYLQGEISKDTLFEKLNIAIHQFSKRQMTWFRKMERDGFVIDWIDIALPFEDKVSYCLKKLSEINRGDCAIS